MERVGIIILGMFWLCVSACSTQNDPVTLAKAIFAKEKFEDIDKHVTGEYDGRPNGSNLPDNVATAFELLDKNDTTAVVAMTIIDSTGKAVDTYLHFVNEGTWKITAFRGLAATGVYGEIAASYDESDSLNGSHEEASSEDLYDPDSEEWIVKNARLVLSSDSDLINYFNANKESLKC